MPEISEVKIVNDWINREAKGRLYHTMRKSTISKVKTSIQDPFEYFTIKAQSRGKELKLIFVSKEGEEKTLICGLGMSGTWDICMTGKEPKHMHLMFDAIDGTTIGLVDVRRFAKWRWGDWNYGRSPDPMMEHDEFQNNIWNNINHNHFKNKTISELLMEQKWFNGIGNYLRSEIVYKADQNPFEIAKSAIENNPKILDLCKQLPIEAYQLGGGQLKDWENPFEVEANSFDEWIQCYSKRGMASTIDKSGRRLWFNPKWIADCPYDI